ncbi:UNVERIFIED_CONTAM: hypothetical protein Sindi_2832700 [Sesamum indicum]
MEVEEVENSFFMCITKDHLSEAVPEGQIYAVNRTTLMIRFGLDKGNDFSLNSWRHLSPAEKAGEQFLEEASLVAGAQKKRYHRQWSLKRLVTRDRVCGHLKLVDRHSSLCSVPLYRLAWAAFSVLSLFSLWQSPLKYYDGCLVSFGDISLDLVAYVGKSLYDACLDKPEVVLAAFIGMFGGL